MRSVTFQSGGRRFLVEKVCKSTTCFFLARASWRHNFPTGLILLTSTGRRWHLLLKSAPALHAMSSRTQAPTVSVFVGFLKLAMYALYPKTKQLFLEAMLFAFHLGDYSTVTGSSPGRPGPFRGRPGADQGPIRGRSGEKKPKKKLQRKLSGITFFHTLTPVPSENACTSKMFNKNQAKINRCSKKN